MVMGRMSRHCDRGLTTLGQVIAAARDATKIPASLGGAKAHTLDPSGPEAEVKRAALAALEIYGRIDVLVNNAGYGVPSVVEELRCVTPVTPQCRG
jgi:NAD(P)-dependent dehydrogenase (short-subunit alcohol dehydrogenase family)